MSWLTDFEWWQIFLSGVATLAVFSFLIRENPIYRLFEHLFIGISTAVGILIAVRSFLWPKVLKPVFGFDTVFYPDGTPVVPYDSSQLWYLVPMAFGSLYYFILSPRYAWLAQLVIGASLGAAAGFAFRGTFAEFLPQFYDSFRPLYVAGSTSQTIGNIVFVFTLVSALIYFFLTIKRTPGGSIDRIASSGRWMMMGCFGAFFGSTIMARMALLVERIEFLIHRWWPAIVG